MTAKEIFTQISEKQGWDTHTDIDVLLAFIDSSRVHLMEFKSFLDDVVREENKPRKWAWTHHPTLPGAFTIATEGTHEIIGVVYAVDIANSVCSLHNREVEHMTEIEE